MLRKKICACITGERGANENNALGVVRCQYAIQYLMETVTVCHYTSRTFSISHFCSLVSLHFWHI
jgi:hypothetical protein